MTKSNPVTDITESDLYKARSRVRHLEFIKHTWTKAHEPFMVGTHTGEICGLVDQAMRDFKKGKSTFLKILVCFRHGKSDIVSRYLPPHFLGENPDCEVMVTSHTSTKANEFSYFGRGLIKSPEYKELYPNVALSSDRQGIEEWSIEDHQGKAQYFGLGSGSAGKGGHLIIIDDYFGKREEAESETMRNKVWNSFTDDIMTRRAPTCICLVVVTPWHTDDVCGRIDQAMIDDPKFPRFKTVRFPAYSDRYKTGVLFPERFTREWYDTQKATLREYGTASLMQCDPILRSGNMLRTDKMKYYDPADLPSDLTMCRAYDLASSRKERMKDDPDYTVGVRGGVKFVPTSTPGVNTPILYIDDIIRGQWEALKRKQIIVDTAMSDGSIRVGIEAFGAYKDAYTEIRDILHGIRTVEDKRMPGDKVSKAYCLEPVCEAGNIWINKNIPQHHIDALINEFQQFPGGKHDDIVDACAVLFNMCQTGGIGLYTKEMFDEDTRTNET